jgi:hypothetical protein
MSFPEDAARRWPEEAAREGGKSDEDPEEEHDTGGDGRSQLEDFVLRGTSEGEAKQMWDAVRRAVRVVCVVYTTHVSSGSVWRMQSHFNSEHVHTCRCI